MADNPLWRWSTSFYWYLFQEVEGNTLTDLDKLYIALAEVDAGHLFDIFCYSFNIKSLKALKDYKSKRNFLVNPDEIDIVKEKIANKNLDFKELTDKVTWLFSIHEFIVTSQGTRIHCTAHKDVLVQAK